MDVPVHDPRENVADKGADVLERLEFAVVALQLFRYVGELSFVDSAHFVTFEHNCRAAAAAVRHCAGVRCGGERSRQRARS